MAPPETPWPVHELENRVHLYTKDYREKSRKLPKDFSLQRDCALEELVQWSCMSQDEIKARAMEGLPVRRTECYEFVRLFRHCKHGNHDFRVETTAWEGPNKWKPSKKQIEEEKQRQKHEQTVAAETNKSSVFAQYGDYFWTGK